jgi:preprotein translocase subunit SecF
MKLTNFILAFAIVLGIQLNAQENTPKQTLENGTIENQFEYLINKSYKYKEYKNVKLWWLERLQKAVDDSLNINKKEIIDLKIIVTEKDNEIKTLTTNLQTTKKDVVQLNTEKDAILFFGVLISKPLYNSILWTIIAILLALLLIYIFRFNRSNSITVYTKDKVNELESEYGNHRQRSLEREQQLRRKLQDEINKQRKDK